MATLRSIGNSRYNTRRVFGDSVLVGVNAVSSDIDGSCSNSETIGWIHRL